MTLYIPRQRRFLTLSSSLSRRRVIAAGAGAAFGFGAFGAAAASASPGGPHSGGPEETRTLDELYQAALKEGGKLVIYAGGVPSGTRRRRDGHSNRSIAQSLFLSEATVKTHLVRIYRKLGVDNRAAAVSEAVRRGLLELT